jgi:hypothetical protein
MFVIRDCWTRYRYQFDNLKKKRAHTQTQTVPFGFTHNVYFIIYQTFYFTLLGKRMPRNRTQDNTVNRKILIKYEGWFSSNEEGKFFEFILIS